MDPRIPLIVFGGLAAGIVLFILGFRWMKEKNLIENIPTSKIRSLAMGLVEIYGSVVPVRGKILKSPMTGDDCVYYKYKIEEYVQSGKSSYWHQIANGEDRVHFFLKDDSGMVLVDTAGANISIPSDYSFQTGWGKQIPNVVRAFMDSEEVRYKGIFGTSKTLKFTEWHIDADDKLYIMGSADDNPFMEEATAQKGMQDIMIQKGKAEKFYFISDRPEKDVLGGLRLKALGGIIGGAALFVVCLFLLISGLVVGY